MLLISLNEFAINLVSNSFFLWLIISWLNHRQTEDEASIQIGSTRLFGVVFVSQLSALYFAIPGINYLLAIAVSSYLINLASSPGWSRSFLIALLSNAGSLALIGLIRLSH